MGRVTVKVEAFVCERCQHQWIPRDAAEQPKQCPRCKSPYWDRPRRDAAKAGAKAKKR